MIRKWEEALVFFQMQIFEVEDKLLSSETIASLLKCSVEVLFKRLELCVWDKDEASSVVLLHT